MDKYQMILYYWFCSVAMEAKTAPIKWEKKLVKSGEVITLSSFVSSKELDTISTKNKLKVMLGLQVWL